MGRRDLRDVSPARVFGKPTLSEVWLGPQQRRARAFGVAAEGQHSAALLLGPRSCGKSIVLDQVLAAVAPDHFFRLSDDWDSGAALLGALLESAGLGGAGLSEIDQRNLLQTFLDLQHRQGNRVVFAVDDAEKLSPDAWGELLRISAMRTGDLVPSMLFAGRPSAAARIKGRQPAMWRLVGANVHNMPAPGSADCSTYIEHRLYAAGVDTAVFPLRARLLIGRLAQGSFTRVNLLAQTAMMLGRQGGRDAISEAMVFDASRRIASGVAARQARGTRARSPSRQGQIDPIERFDDGVPTLHEVRLPGSH